MNYVFYVLLLTSLFVNVVYISKNYDASTSIKNLERKLRKEQEYSNVSDRENEELEEKLKVIKKKKDDSDQKIDSLREEISNISINSQQYFNLIKKIQMEIENFHENKD